MLKRIIAYNPVNKQEEVDQEAIISFLKKNDDAYDRTNLIGHMTSSAIILNKTYDKVLFAHHNIYNAWGWVGGHADGNTNLLEVAIKEAKEETGVQTIIPFDENILGIDIIHVTTHLKNKKFVGDHLHLNLTYLLMASESEQLVVKHDENSDVAWFKLDDVLNHVDEKRMIPIYKKLLKQAKKRVQQ